MRSLANRVVSIPIYAIIQSHLPAKDIQSTADRQVYSSIAQLLDLVKIFYAFPSTGVCYWNIAPFAKPLHEFLVYTSL